MKYVEFDSKMFQSFEYETTVQSQSDGSILGICELGKASIQLINEENNYSSYKGSWIKTIHGSFYIYDVTPVQEKINIKLDCYDIKYKLDIPYDSSKHTFPCTLKEWRNSIFNVCDVTYDDSDFPNCNLILEKEPYVGDNPSNRTVISIIAQAGASIVITDELDCFYFDWFSNTVHTANDWSSLTTEKEYSLPINCVVLGRGDVEDNVFYPITKPTNPIEFRIDNNYILDPQDATTNEDKRYETIVPIYDRLNGFNYLVFNMTSKLIPNKLSIKLGQKIKYIDIWGNELVASIMTKKINWLGGNLENDDNYEITLSAKEVKETSTELSYASSVPNDILRVERKADKNTGKIQDLVSEVTENTELIAKTEIEVGKVNLEVSKKVDGKDFTGANIILAINNDESEAQITADKIILTANDILNLIAGNELNLTGRNITISATNFSVDKDGNTVMNNAIMNNATIQGENSKLHIKTNKTFDDAVIITGLFNGHMPTEIKIGNYISYYRIYDNGSIYKETTISPARIKTPSIESGNIDSGRCTLTSSGNRTIYFNKTFDTVPNVVLTPLTSTNGVIAAKMSEITTNYFTANIGGTNFGDNEFCWVAIAN